MDKSSLSQPSYLLDDLESIRELLHPNAQPPVLNDAIDLLDIPLLCDVILPDEPSASPAPSSASQAFRAAAEAAAVALQAQSILEEPANTFNTAVNRPQQQPAAAQASLIVKQVLAEYLPQIEAEIERRLTAQFSQQREALEN